VSLPILTLITFLPIIGVLFILSIDSKKQELIRVTSLLVSIVVFFISLPLYFNFDAHTYDMQFIEKLPWIPSFGINYYVGIDGVSLFLILLTTFITPLSILASWHITKSIKEYMIAMLVLETGMIGVFISLDLFLFYVFWELMLIPMYLLIGIWGGPRRIYAAVKFFIYTMAGSVFMLLAIIALYFLNYRAARYIFCRPILVVPSLCACICHQGSYVPIPYVAAGRPRGSPYSGKCNPGGRPFKNGNLWFCAILFAFVPGGKPCLHPGNFMDGYCGHYLSCLGFYGAGRP